MKFTAVEQIPVRTRRCKKNLRNILDEFVNMNVEFAKFEFNENEYKTAKSASGNLNAAAKKYGYPVKVYLRNNEVYFARRDI